MLNTQLEPGWDDITGYRFAEGLCGVPVDGRGETFPARSVTAINGFQHPCFLAV